MRLVTETLSIPINSIDRGVTRESFILEIGEVPWDLPTPSPCPPGESSTSR